MAILPVVGAVAGVAGTVSQMSAQQRASRQQQQAAVEQRRIEEEQHRLLIKQREVQRLSTLQQSQRAKTQEDIVRNQRLFNLALEEQAIKTQGIQEQFGAAQAEFAARQQEALQNAQAYGEEIQRMNQLFQVGEEQGARLAEVGAASSEVTAALGAAGQLDSAAATAQLQRIALEMDNASQRGTELFNTTMSQSDQQLEAVETLTALQRQLGLSEVELGRLMGDMQRSTAGLVNRQQQDAAQMEYAMNRAAIDTETAAQIERIEAATSAEEVRSTAAMADINTRAAMAKATAPSALDWLGGLANAGIGLYDALTPVRPAPVQTTNPWYNTPAQPSFQQGLFNLDMGGSTPMYKPNMNSLSFGGSSTRPSLNYRQGVMTDTTNNLFNLA